MKLLYVHMTDVRRPKFRLSEQLADSRQTVNVDTKQMGVYCLS